MYFIKTLTLNETPAPRGNRDIVGDTLAQIVSWVDTASDVIEKFSPFSIRHPLHERHESYWGKSTHEQLQRLTLLRNEGSPAEIRKPQAPRADKTLPDQIKPHKFAGAVDPVLPPHWFGESPFMTHLLNSWNIMFPAAERYFVRWSKKALEKVKDPKIRKEILGFIGQESQHAHQHEKMWELLREQGYNIEPLRIIVDDFFFGLLERSLPDSWNYSGVAAFEHFTALFAEIYFETPALMDRMHPDMQALFEWHAAEEIEHKAVAFDQLLAVNDSYFLRTGAMNVAVVMLYSLTIGHSFYMMWQDKSIYDWQSWLHDAYELFGKYDVAQKTMVKFFEYYRPDFHPWDNENYHLAQLTLSNYAAPRDSVNEKPRRQPSINAARFFEALDLAFA